jgi:hypothetical protein
MVTLGHLKGRQFNGYLHMKLPHELDEVVTSVVEAYRKGPPAARKKMLDEMSVRPARVLSSYGQRMAAVAVRTRSYEPLHRGLIGIGMADATIDRLDDYREHYGTLAALNHAASVLGRNLTAYLDDVSPLLPKAALDRFRQFAERDPNRLEELQVRAVGSGDDFRYL